MLGHADRTWRTHDVAAPDQFRAWEQMAAEAFTPVTLSRPPAAEGDEGNGGFLTACAMRAVGDLGIAWLDTDAQRVEHSVRHVAQGSSGVYFLNLPLAGSGVALQDGRVSMTGAGDFVLVNADRPFTLAFESRLEQISLAIPRHLLDPLLAEPDQSNCVVIKGDVGAGAIASSAIRALAAQRGRLGPRETRGITDHLMGLVALAVSSTMEGGSASLRVRRYQAVLDEVERRLDDPGLSPQDVARELSISVSYLTKLFAEHGTSFGRTVLARRLDRARSLLAAGSGGDGDLLTVTAVATACGFQDSGYFARAFRARFGITPSACRTAHPQLH